MAGERRITSIKHLIESIVLKLGTVTLEQPIQITIDGQPIQIDGSLDEIDINSIPNLVIAEWPDLTISGSPDVVIDSIPSLTISTLPNLIISSLPTVNVAKSLTPVTPTKTNTNVSTSSVQIAAANANRKAIIIRNQHTSGRVHINFGSAATTADLLLEAGETYTMPEGKTYTGVINAISNTAVNKPVSVVEWS